MTITLDIKVGDIVLGGKFKNKRTVVKTIGTDDLGQPTINGKPLLKFRIEKHLPKEKQSKKTREMVKLTKSQLKEIIREAVREFLDEKKKRRNRKKCRCPDGSRSENCCPKKRKQYGFTGYRGFGRIGLPAKIVVTMTPSTGNGSGGGTTGNGGMASGGGMMGGGSD